MAEKMFIWFFSFRFHRNGFQIYYFLWFNHFEIVHCFWFWCSTVRNRILYIIIFQCQCTECTYSAQHMVCGGRLFCNFINIFQHIIMSHDHDNILLNFISLWSLIWNLFYQNRRRKKVCSNNYFYDSSEKRNEMDQIEKWICYCASRILNMYSNKYFLNVYTRSKINEN